MFGKKKAAAPPLPPTFTARTIPAEFYGGLNPEVTFKTVTKEFPLVSEPAASSHDKKMFDQATATGSGQPLHPVNLLTRPRFLLLFGGILFIITIIVISLYYWRQAKLAATPRVDTAPPLATVIETPPEPVATVVEATPVIEATSTEAVVSPRSLVDIDFKLPSGLLGTTQDSDKDGLTDIEEELYKTDPGVVDTDADGYSDDLEIDNLYNPAGQAPVRLLDAGTVKEFSNPVFGYSVVYPVNWAGGLTGNVDPNYRDVLFSTITGEIIQVLVFDKDSTNQSFADWFGLHAPEERFSEIEDFVSYYKVPGFKRRDGLVYYFVEGNRVYVIAYHTTNSSAVNFPTVMKMMARSWRFVDSTEVESDLETAPSFAPATTSGSGAAPATSSASMVNSTTVEGV